MRPRPTRRPRRGAAVIEFALVAPIVFILLFGALEFSRMNMIRHTADVASYEAARRGVIPGATSANITTQATNVLNQIGVKANKITVTPSTFTRATPSVTVTVEVDLKKHTWVPLRYFSPMTIQSTTTLSREVY